MVPSPPHDPQLGASTAALGLSDASLTLLRDLISDRAGVWFDDQKLGILADKVTELVTAQGLGSLLDYYYLLRYDAEAPRHWQRLMDRLAVPETYFWRQADQFEALARVIAPKHFERQPSARLRVWSAACCTGEEPLSVAIALAEAGIPPDRVQIAASDGSAAMVERARQGVYRERSFRQLPLSLRDKYFESSGDGGWRPRRCLTDTISWRVANLMNVAEWADLANSDVVFCRNVFIYFSERAIRRVAGEIAARMPPHGHLFLGASESLTRLGLPVELAEIDRSFVYVRERQQP